MKKILSLLAIQQPEDVIGKKLKVEFFDEANDVYRTICFSITSFEITETELCFPSGTKLERQY